MDNLKNPESADIIEASENTKLTTFSRYITPEWPRLTYRRRYNKYKPQLHWGQRKLLLSEIEFLTMFDADYVLYIGSADGKHIKYLSDLFPKIKFILYDPRRFHPITYNYAKTSGKIEIRQKFFVDEDVAEFKKYKNLLFISDIRNVPTEGVQYNRHNEDTIPEDETFDQNVIEDMKRQMDWCTEIRPLAAMNKFRLPYTPGKTTYLGGKQYFQTWAGDTSSETRLITTDFDERVEYDHQDYENCTFYLNNCFRSKQFTEFIPENIKSLYRYYNYDVLAECYILNQYIEKFKPTYGLQRFIENINKELEYTMAAKYEIKNEKAGKFFPKEILVQ